MRDTFEELKMEEAAVVGLDLAKNVPQVSGAAAGGSVAVRRQLRQPQVRSYFRGCRQAYDFTRAKAHLFGLHALPNMAATVGLHVRRRISETDVAVRPFKFK